VAELIPGEDDGASSGDEVIEPGSELLHPLVSCRGGMALPAVGEDDDAADRRARANQPDGIGPSAERPFDRLAAVGASCVSG
jgi:hypothetical protein